MWAEMYRDTVHGGRGVLSTIRTTTVTRKQKVKENAVIISPVA